MELCIRERIQMGRLWHSWIDNGGRLHSDGGRCTASGAGCTARGGRCTALGAAGMGGNCGVCSGTLPMSRGTLKKVTANIFQLSLAHKFRLLVIEIIREVMFRLEVGGTSSPICFDSVLDGSTCIGSL